MTLLAMSLWFSASFVGSLLVEERGLGPGVEGWLAVGVQIGFVAGALILAVSGLADAWPPQRIITVGSALAALSNLALLLAESAVAIVILRLLTGMCLAAVYPMAVKVVAGWFAARRGTALGLIIGALTLGSAMPHLAAGFDVSGWRPTIVVTSILALGAAGLAWRIRSGPHGIPSTRLNMRGAMASQRRPSVILSNLGYIGHMWELYAMWAWIALFLGHDGRLADLVPESPAVQLSAFTVIGIGAVGCYVGGRISDRFGATVAAGIAMLLSGGCAILLALGGSWPVPVVLGICLLWGFWAIADSAQFSALVSRHAPQEYVGAAVSIQLAAGYLVSLVTVWLTPGIADSHGWPAALVVLAAGPAVGVAAMGSLHILTKAKERQTA
ncbi:MFS transporter [Arthrobacter sp. I2-34]|uniref:MFS transporter n=1 Tax=Arthrobacter hankyongi TaxID=2904801 RepID=A0ABS9L7K7_9MICC|nr:MFS transporter [Arthrobacter hankyongi]MCG2622611.1 MFS transporter [Arthrobacter hankyongi]